jgi:hypothetical protein
MQINELQEALLKFYFNEISPVDFAGWMNSQTEAIGAQAFENLVGSEVFLDLISARWVDSNEVLRLKEVARNLYGELASRIDQTDVLETSDPNTKKWRIYRDKAISICESILSGSRSMADGCKALAKLDMGQFGFEDRSFEEWDDEFDRLGVEVAQKAYGDAILRQVHSFIPVKTQGQHARYRELDGPQ